MLSFDEYISQVKSLPFGKRVGKNLYILWPDLAKVSPPLASLLEPLGPVSDTTLIKFFLDQFKVSFLSYPEFFSNPHPALNESITLDLTTGKKRNINYRHNENPPILHRKETMISLERPQYASWLQLTKQLEQKGCYAEPRKIGFKKYWQLVLSARGLSYQGHDLIVSEDALKRQTPLPNNNETSIERHKTAMSRTDFSRPVQFLLKHKLLTPEQTFFDYGCGLGDDIRALQHNGYKAYGWDPVHAPDGEKKEAAVVNLGFVLNVIDDPYEREETLIKAFELAQTLLCVAVVTDTAPTAKDIRPYKDGFLTSRGTFQKYFKHEEAHEWIEGTLNCSAYTLSPGIFLIFKKEEAAQDFLSTKQKRNINWDTLNLHIYPSKDEREAARKEILFNKHKRDLEEYWKQLLSLGREPTITEFPKLSDLKETLRMNSRKLQEWFVERYGQEALQTAFNNRRDDLLVYLGLANFKRRIPFSSLSPRLKKDMKTFFGSYKAGQQEALRELFKIGNPDEVENRANSVHFEKNIGRLDEQALYLDQSHIDKLDPILRMYVGVAGLLYGEIDEVDEIKIHKRSGKVTFLIKKAPDLKLREYWRVKIDLTKQKVMFYKH